jgi:hypothetical protein
VNAPRRPRRFDIPATRYRMTIARMGRRQAWTVPMKLGLTEIEFNKEFRVGDAGDERIEQGR